MGDVAPPLGIVTGLQVEAEIARTIPGAIVACVGPGPDNAEQAAEYLVAQGAKSLMSFGIAGALDPALLPGDLIAYPAYLAKAVSAKAGILTTSAVPVLTPADKAALRKASAASAVDMETGAVRAIAKAHALPFMMLRAICDTAEDTIPDLALKGVTQDGYTRAVRVAAGLLMRPQDLSALMTLGKRQAAAMRALRAAAGRVLGD